jgi:TonB family protein
MNETNDNMKRQFKYFFIASVVCAGMGITGCTMSGDKNNNDKTADMSAADKNAGTTTPNGNIIDSSSVNDTAKANGGILPAKKEAVTDKMADKKGKKGKVTVEMNENTPGTAADMKMDKSGFYSNVEVWPAYPGGQNELERFFENNIQYPDAAADNGTEGVVKISFDVDESGKIYAPKVISKPVGDGVDAEALRVFNKMPSWTPGKIKGKNVKTHFTLPVRFQLG